MSTEFQEAYDHIRSGRAGFYETKRGLIAIWGKEAVQFLDGLISNDMKTLEDSGQMLAAFPNAQGRLLAAVRVQRQGERFLFETEEATHEKVFQNLFRFTFAGDFFVEDLSDGHSYFEIFGPKEDVYNPGVAERFPGSIAYELPYGAAYFVPNDLADNFRVFLAEDNGCLTISDELYDTLRVESGLPLYGIDMDDTTIVPELGVDGLISYNKGCYIGQEIIARIHFRGHVAKKLTGLVLSEPPDVADDTELSTSDGKNAGRVTSIAFSPKLNKTIALAFVRYDYLASGTEILLGKSLATVTDLPFIK
ncbi:MAG TPA: glycine cleavage T C-terminal barrel domain-containing protein [Pyrinomonadaceae bacterium]|nr:glycine cleavage T C-terminal barrel domain-containing protein [Pyrinomonadaceae bacterium]